MEGTVVVFAILVLSVITIGLGVRLVPQGSKQVVQRLGKYHKNPTTRAQYHHSLCGLSGLQSHH